jgi:hypothetical protein
MGKGIERGLRMKEMKNRQDIEDERKRKEDNNQSIERIQKEKTEKDDEKSVKGTDKKA